MSNTVAPAQPGLADRERGAAFVEGGAAPLSPTAAGARPSSHQSARSGGQEKSLGAALETQPLRQLLRKRSLRFEDAGLQAEYVEFRFQKSLRAYQIALVVGAVLAAFQQAVLLTDRYDDPLWYQACSPVLLLVPSMCFYFLSRRPAAVRYFPAMTMYSILVTNAFIGTEASLTGYVATPPEERTAEDDSNLVILAWVGTLVSMSLATPFFRAPVDVAIVSYVLCNVYTYARLAQYVSIEPNIVLISLISFALFTYSSISVEQLLLRIFLFARRMRIDNNKLTAEVKKLESSAAAAAAPKADFNSPLQGVLQQLSSIIANERDEEQREALEAVRATLSDNAAALLLPNLKRQIAKGELEVDVETRAWLQGYYEHGSEGTAEAGSMKALGVLNTTSTLEGMVVHDDLSSDPQVIEALSLWDTWEFDVFHLADVCEQRPLVPLAHHIMSSLELYSTLKIAPAPFRQFVAQIEAGYLRHKPEFHSNIHAADVLQCMAHLLATSTVRPMMSDIELFAGIFAAIIHDVDHPGFNNAFLVATEHDLAIVYNDQSVLENHHLATAFQLLRVQKDGPFSGWDRRLFKRFRGIVVKTVLATDMTNHFGILGRIKTLLSEAGDGTPKEERNTLVLGALLKISDISNPLRPGPLSRRWVTAITSEFFGQGAAEASHGLPISPFMDERTTSIPKSQVGFIDFLVQPLVATLHEFLMPLDELVECMQANRAYWADKERAGKLPAIKP